MEFTQTDVKLIAHICAATGFARIKFGLRQLRYP
jgi:hypothetical protein